MSIFNEFFGLKEIHKYNTIIKGLEKQTLPAGKTEEVLQLLNASIYLDNKLTDFVEGSAKYNELKSKIDGNAEISKTLKDYSYKNETIISDYSISRIYKIITLFKHTITYDTTQPISGWEYDEETGEEYEVTGEEDVTVTEFFYTSGYSDELIENLSDMLMPYDTPNGSHNHNGNHIQEMLDASKNMAHELYVRKECDKLGYNFRLFSKVFDIKDVIFLGSYDVYAVKFNNNTYHLRDIETLLSEVVEARAIKYICEDKYVRYPYVCYARFLKENLGNTHFVESAQES